MSKARQLAQKPSQPTGRKNIIINGGMQVHQRASSDVTGLGGSDGYHYHDRYQAQFNTSARFTFSDETSDVPAGFSNALKISTTTADTTVAAGEYFVIQQAIEGQNVQHLKIGTSDAEKVTVSFYAKANAAATYMCELQTLDGTIQNAQHQFSVTTSWQRFTLTFDGNTSGTADNDNGSAFECKFWLHAGTDFTSGTYTAGEFSGNTSADRAVGISSIADSTSRTFFLTGLQVEVGSVATEFEHRSYAEELALCQRYFYSTLGTLYGADYGSNSFTRTEFPVEMRVAPTVTGSNNKTVLSTYHSVHRIQYYLSGNASALAAGATADAEL